MGSLEWPFVMISQEVVKIHGKIPSNSLKLAKNPKDARMFNI